MPEFKSDIDVRKKANAHLRYNMPTMAFLTEWLEMVPQESIEDYDRDMWVSEMIVFFDKTNEQSCKYIQDGFSHLDKADCESAVFEYKKEKILSKAGSINKRIKDKGRNKLKLPKSKGRTTSGWSDIADALEKHGIE